MAKKEEKRKEDFVKYNRSPPFKARRCCSGVLAVFGGRQKSEPGRAGRPSSDARAAASEVRAFLFFSCSGVLYMPCSGVFWCVLVCSGV